MVRHSGIGGLLMAAMLGSAGTASAQALGVPALPSAEEQWEADYRVIAARCGTPAFEKNFSAHSRQAVAAGLVSRRADPATVERTIGSLRRSSLTLVATSSDCPAKLAQLAQLQRTRQSGLAASGKRPAVKPR